MKFNYSIYIYICFIFVYILFFILNNNIECFYKNKFIYKIELKNKILLENLISENENNNYINIPKLDFYDKNYNIEYQKIIGFKQGPPINLLPIDSDKKYNNKKYNKK